MCFSNPNQRLGPSGGEAADEIFPAHAGVDQNRNRTDFVKCEDMGDEVDARRHHQGHSHAGLDPTGLKLGGDGTGSSLQLGEGYFRILQSLTGQHFELCRSRAGWAGHGNLIGEPLGGFGKCKANILQVVQPPRR